MASPSSAGAIRQAPSSIGKSQGDEAARFRWGCGCELRSGVDMADSITEHNAVEVGAE